MLLQFTLKNIQVGETPEVTLCGTTEIPATCLKSTRLYQMYAYNEITGTVAKPLDSCDVSDD